MENELVELESVYEDPGFLLLARNDEGERLGCVGLRSVTELIGTGEIRRMFVRPEGRGAGTGVALVEGLLRDAAARGFDRLVLNTLPSMRAAVQLYRRFGFVSCEPYVDEPLEGTLYFERRL